MCCLKNRNIVQKFSTFIKFEDDRFADLITNPQLQISINNHLELFPNHQKNEQFCALYWYQRWQNEPNTLNKYHLLAYFQEPCYWVSRTTFRTFDYLNLPYTIPDYFQIAIVEFEQVLQTYNPTFGSKLSNYATLKFQSIIFNILRQKKQANTSTDWALLRYTSRKTFMASLGVVNFSERDINSYDLAWTCFNEIYTPTQSKMGQRLPAPSAETWQIITLAYNQRNLLFQITPQKIKQMLREIAGLIRNYLYPEITSLNQKLNEETNTELIDSIPDTIDPIEKLISEEEINSRRIILQEMNQLLETQINNFFSEEMQAIFTLCYGHNLTQTQIANELNTTQATVSRRITRGRKLLLDTLVKWTQETLDRRIDCNTINEMSQYLTEWLYTHYET